MHRRHDRTRSAALGALLSFLFAFPVPQPASLAAVPGGDQLVPVVSGGGVGAGGPATTPAGPGPPSWRTTPLAPVVADGPAAAGLAEVPSETTALLADFDGDHRTDLFWYGPGVKDDHLWLGRPDRNFVGVPVEVAGTYQPLVGDFNGDGRADVFWYGPGAGSDVVWYGQATGGFAGLAVTINGTYQPIVGDFNGNGRADVFWYGPGAANDVIWYGQADGGFAGQAVTVNGSYLPLVGDFNGDGPADIFWYGPGTTSDVVWYGQAVGGFAGRAVTVNGSYLPLVGDFNGDGRADIFWYGPGAANDVVWYGQATGGFAGLAIDMAGTYQPFTGDFDGDGRADVFWYAPGAGSDVVWYGQSGGFSGVATPVQGTYQPLVGDFGGDGPNDVLWWVPGVGNDVLWFGHTDRRFTARTTTVDLDYARALAIRPDTIANQYNPYGFVAHAMGAIDGQPYSNSLEAFQRNYDRGFRVFECDQVLLADGTVLVAHDGLEANYGLNKAFPEATWADLAGHKYLGQYTILRSEDILQLLIQHPDVYVIPDPKYSRPEIFGVYVRQATALGRLDVLQRLLPHVADQAELNTLRLYFPLQNYVLALYHTQALNRYDDPEVVDFVRRNRTPAVMMWWRDRDFSISLAANGQQSRRFRQAFADSLRSAGAVVYVHSLADPVQIQRFWDLRIGGYSDEPFPPLVATTPALKTPTFTNRTKQATPPA